MDLLVFVGVFTLVFFGGALLIDYACSAYFRHKLNHFKQISSEMTKSHPTKQGERNGQK